MINLPLQKTMIDIVRHQMCLNLKKRAASHFLGLIEVDLSKA